MMRLKYILRTGSLAIAVLMLAGYARSQGGKAEPKRIEISPGKQSAVLTGSLRTAQEMDFVFAARKGQKVTIKNPGHTRFDVRVFVPESGFDTEFDSSQSFGFVIETDGDHLLFVRRKAGPGPRNARFNISITIK